MRAMLAKDYAAQNPRGGWMSEKLDGVFGWWTGEVLLTIEGNPLYAPDWFTADLPKGALNGELYIGKNKFQHTLSTVTKKIPVDAEWKKIRLRVFDAPAVPGGFETRIEQAEALVAGCRFASMVDQHRCRDRAHFDEFFSTTCRAGGEGVMWRAPGSLYVADRQSWLLKRKPFDYDHARVIGYSAGKGKFAGLVGALEVEWRGLVFKLGAGMTVNHRERPPALGSSVRFSYSGAFDDGKPKCAALIAA